MQRRLFITVLASVALLAFGCGENSAPSVKVTEASIVATRDRVDFALERVTRAQSREDLLTRMDEAAVAIDAAADDLGDRRSRGAPATSATVDSLRQLSTSGNCRPDPRDSASPRRQGWLRAGTR
jgi:hypothetical protein